MKNLTSHFFSAQIYEMTLVVIIIFKPSVCVFMLLLCIKWKHSKLYKISYSILHWKVCALLYATEFYYNYRCAQTPYMLNIKYGSFSYKIWLQSDKILISIKFLADLVYICIMSNVHV